LRNPDAGEFNYRGTVRLRRDQLGRKAGRTNKMTIAESENLN
jgi:hypothetical protein